MRAGLRIVSGGQTGADRAALRWAMNHGFPTGGWCPARRWAEDGRIPSRYPLHPTPTPAPEQRTRWNVRDSDATLIFSIRSRLTGGTLLTLDFAQELRKPVLVVRPDRGERAALAVLRFLGRHPITTLNIAGPRRSEEPSVGAFVTQTLQRLLALAQG